MNILVTGGLGFIGSHLVDLLLQEKHTITILDNMSSNVVDESFYKDKCKVIVNSISEVELDCRYDVLFHLASVVGPAGVLKYCGDIGNSIVGDTEKLCNYCIKNNCLFVNISTSEVYGHKERLHEDSDKVFSGEYKTRTEYAAAKLLSEIITCNKAKVNNLKYHIIRPFNVAGSRQKPNGGFVLPRFVIAALTDQPLTIFGDGSQIRAFTNVYDICKAILAISEHTETNDIWNIGNPLNRIEIRELADRVIKLSNRECKKVFIDPKDIYGDLFSEVNDKTPYVDKVIMALNWEPIYGIDATICEVIDYYYEMVKEYGYYYDMFKKNY